MIHVAKVSFLDWVTVCRDIYQDARPEDIREWQTASGGEDFMASLARAVQGPNVWAVWSDFGAIVVYGVNPVGTDTARGWLLLTHEALHHLLSIHKLFLKFLEDLPYQDLTCWADSRNTVHLEWLERVGFEQGAVSEIIGGVRFLLFRYTKEQ